jgi:hypothetical protein
MYDEEPCEQELYEQETNFVIYEGVVVPESVLLKQEKSSRYGGVPDLPDGELAGQDELERFVAQQEFGPVLLLPKPKADRYKPAWDASQDPDFNAFLSEDFKQSQPKFDKLGYKVDRLKDERKNVLLMVAMLRARISGMEKDSVLKYVDAGVIDADDIENWDMWQLAKLYLRSVRIRKEIKQLEEKRRARQEKRLQKWFDHLYSLPERG